MVTHPLLPTLEWGLDCRDGTLSPAGATLFYEVANNNDSAASTYSVDFIMQWSEDVTMNSTLTGFQMGIPYEYILTYLYPAEGLYNTNFTAIVRIDKEASDDSSNVFAHSKSGSVQIEEENCVYPVTLMTPSMTPTIMSEGSDAGTPTATKVTSEPSVVSAGNGARGDTLFSSLALTAGVFFFTSFCN